MQLINVKIYLYNNTHNFIHTKGKILAYDYGYPKEFLDVESYDHTFWVHGLFIDVKQGNFLKIESWYASSLMESNNPPPNCLHTGGSREIKNIIIWTMLELMEKGNYVSGDVSGYISSFSLLSAMSVV